MHTRYTLRPWGWQLARASCADFTPPGRRGSARCQPFQRLRPRLQPTAHIYQLTTTFQSQLATCHLYKKIFSALEVFWNDMRYINARFTYFYLHLPSLSWQQTGARLLYRLQPFIFTVCCSHTSYMFQKLIYLLQRQSWKMACCYITKKLTKTVVLYAAILSKVIIAINHCHLTNQNDFTDFSCFNVLLIFLLWVVYFFGDFARIYRKEQLKPLGKSQFCKTEKTRFNVPLLL